MCQVVQESIQSEPHVPIFGIVMCNIFSDNPQMQNKNTMGSFFLLAFAIKKYNIKLPILYCYTAAS